MRRTTLPYQRFNFWMQEKFHNKMTIWNGNQIPEEFASPEQCCHCFVITTRFGAYTEDWHNMLNEDKKVPEDWIRIGSWDMDHYEGTNFIVVFPGIQSLWICKQCALITFSKKTFHYNCRKKRVCIPFLTNKCLHASTCQLWHPSKEILKKFSKIKCILGKRMQKNRLRLQS